MPSEKGNNNTIDQPKPKRKDQVEDKLENETISNGKRPAEKLNPNIKVPVTNILQTNQAITRVLAKQDSNHIANKLKNFDITNDEDDIYFANNHNHYSNLIDDEKEENENQNDNKKEKEKSYLENGKYKDIKVPQKYNNYSSNIFKGSFGKK